MRSEFVPEGRLAEHRPANPERVAYRHGPGVFSDVELRAWPSAGAMRQAVRMSDTGKLGARPWHAWIDRGRLRQAVAREGESS